MSHRSNLDVLRTFAVLCVVAHHLILTLHTHVGIMEESRRHWIAALGHAGVLAFFVHTSLVLMYSLERMQKKGGPMVWPFYLRRFFRIYPLAMAAIGIALFCGIPSRTWDVAKAVSHTGVVANLLLVQNLWTKEQVLGPLWSLPYEVQMYVVLPFLYLLACKRRGSFYLLGLIGLFAIVGIVIARATAHLNMAAYVPCFLSGVLCYSLRRSISRFIPARLWPVFLLSLIAAFVLTSFAEEPAYWAGWIFCLLLGLSINMFHDSNAQRLNWVSARAALYSYGVYLLHVPALFLVFLLWKVRSLWWGPLLFATLTVAFSVIAFHVLESPFIELGRRLSGETRAEAALTEPAPELQRS